MRTQEILQSKGNKVHSIRSDATLSQVVQLLVQYDCGSLLVRDGEEVVGIITERDILRACATEKRELSQILVRERMSANLVTATSQDGLDDVMGILTEKRVRHLPIIDDGQLAGIISIGDVVKAQHDRLSMENHFLKTYIHST
ncbi:MAG: CBS domain-containing protein [Pirellulaceae bacterium]|nr:CBS domain-containing protein [Planctomycetales bacterium]